MQQHKSCKTCSAFAEHGRGPGQPHECRGGRPVAQIIGAGQNALTKQPEPIIATFWPTVKTDNWCREWAPQFDAQAD